MTNSDLYLEEVRHISDRYEKRHSDLVHRALTFLQINGALLTLLLLIRSQDDFNGGESLFGKPLMSILLSIILCLITFLPFRTPELNIDVNFNRINEDELSVIQNSMIYEYIKKIKSLRYLFYFRIGTFISAMILFGVAMYLLSPLIMMIPTPQG